METWDAIRSRRNVRMYTDRPIPAEHLDRILEAGWRAPSASNGQPWDFVLVTARPQLTDLAKVWRGGTHVARSAATVALVGPASRDEAQGALMQYDHGQATMSMMITAADLGVGSCHSAVGDQSLAREVLGHPPDHMCTYLVAFGYPADRSLAPMVHPNRRPYDRVVHRGRWGDAALPQ
jgi:nitroreductase